MSLYPLAKIHALWIGETLGPIAQCCLTSFIQNGHQVYLHSYTDIKDIPQGVIQVDADKIISQDKIIKHKATGSYALFSDIFRYELLKQMNGDGIYVDCDVYCIAPITQEDYILGYEDDHKINGAILALPSQSPVLEKLLRAAYDPYFIPPWYSNSKQFRFKLKKILGLARHIAEMPWGVIGPEAITYYMREAGLLEKCKAIDYYYPIHYSCISKLLDPALRLNDVISSRTQCIHLYNEMLRPVDLSQLDADCILAKMLNNTLSLNKSSHYE